MQKTFTISIAALTVLAVAGCNNDAQQDTSDLMTQPIEYRMNNGNQQGVEFTEDKKPNTPLTIAEKTSERRTNPNGNPDSSKESDQIAWEIRDKIKEIPGVHDVQAMVTDEKINVALDTEDEFRGNPNLLNKIRDAIEPLANGRKIQIYTDGAYFDRMRNISSSPNQLE